MKQSAVDSWQFRVAVGSQQFSLQWAVIVAILVAGAACSKSTQAEPTPVSTTPEPVAAPISTAVRLNDDLVERVNESESIRSYAHRSYLGRSYGTARFRFRAYVPLDGRRPFPLDNWWNLEIAGAPIDAQSDAFIDFVGRTRALHPDFGPRHSVLLSGLPPEYLPRHADGRLDHRRQR